MRTKPGVAGGTLREILADHPFSNGQSDLSTILAAAPKVRKWPDSDRWSIGVRKCCCLNFCLFRHLKRIVNLDAQVSHCAFKLGMAK